MGQSDVGDESHGKLCGQENDEQETGDGQATHGWEWSLVQRAEGTTGLYAQVVWKWNPGWVLWAVWHLFSVKFSITEEIQGHVFQYISN